MSIIEYRGDNFLYCELWDHHIDFESVPQTLDCLIFQFRLGVW